MQSVKIALLGYSILPLRFFRVLLLWLVGRRLHVNWSVCALVSARMFVGWLGRLGLAALVSAGMFVGWLGRFGRFGRLV